MRSLTPADVFDLCDRGEGYGPSTRALLLLGAASPDASWDELAELPLGERDRRLLRLRAATLGPRLEAQARCPACKETAEVDLDTAELLDTGEAVPELELFRGDLRVRVRPVMSRDLLAVETCGAVEEVRRRIAESCLLAAWRNEEPVAPADLAPWELDLVAEALASADSGAELLLDLSCPSCGQAWQELLDVAAFFWAELERRSSRVVLEIHLLARAYGWREADVLAVSPRRRRQYLELLGA
ncbi:MAG TPA: hypothetical protein VGK45_04950 [Thermoanaerobaculia bacterium]